MNTDNQLRSDLARVTTERDKALQELEDTDSGYHEIELSKKRLEHELARVTAERDQLTAAIELGTKSQGEVIDRWIAENAALGARVAELEAALRNLQEWEGTEGFEEYLQKAFAVLARAESSTPACEMCGGYGQIPTFDRDGNETGTEPCQKCYWSATPIGTDVIPEIIDEASKAGCAKGNETIGYLAGEISRLRSALARAESATPKGKCPICGEPTPAHKTWCNSMASATPAKHPDTERLDWLEAQEGEGIGTLHLSRIFSGGMGRSWFKKEIRAAIDAAMNGGYHD